MPLATAFFAAICAHVSIDIVGDYVLAHDSYDDPVHGSRWYASLALAISAVAALALLLRALLAETRGRVGAFRAALSAAVPASGAAFACVVVAIALPLLLAMAWLDVHSAGIATDDIADLFGGSLPLGASVTLAFGCASAFALHRLLAAATRHRRSIVRAFEAFVRARCGRSRESGVALSAARDDRPRVALALARCTSGNRAPPVGSTVTLLT
jgi:hypothetical protein